MQDKHEQWASRMKNSFFHSISHSVTSSPVPPISRPLIPFLFLFLMKVSYWKYVITACNTLSNNIYIKEYHCEKINCWHLFVYFLKVVCLFRHDYNDKLQHLFNSMRIISNPLHALDTLCLSSQSVYGRRECTLYIVYYGLSQRRSALVQKFSKTFSNYKILGNVRTHQKYKEQKKKRKSTKRLYKRILLIN